MKGGFLNQATAPENPRLHGVNRQINDLFIALFGGKNS